MNPEIKSKWVSALRSGEYQQGQKYLQQDGRFCCLGVLCDLYAKEHPNAIWSRFEDNEYTDFCTEDGKEFNAFLPHKVQKWSGLENNIGEFETTDETLIPSHRSNTSSLAHLNDDCNYDFNKIADIIEEKF